MAERGSMLIEVRNVTLQSQKALPYSDIQSFEYPEDIIQYILFVLLPRMIGRFFSGKAKQFKEIFTEADFVQAVGSFNRSLIFLHGGVQLRITQLYQKFEQLNIGIERLLPYEMFSIENKSFVTEYGNRLVFPYYVLHNNIEDSSYIIRYGNIYSLNNALFYYIPNHTFNEALYTYTCGAVQLERERKKLVAYEMQKDRR